MPGEGSLRVKTRAYRQDGQPPASATIGQIGIDWLAEAAMTIATSMTTLIALIAAKMPLEVQMRSGPSSEREKSAIRAASPRRAGETEFTSEPIPKRARA